MPTMTLRQGLYLFDQG